MKLGCSNQFFHSILYYQYSIQKTAAPIAIANPAKCMETLPSNHIDSEIFAGNCLNTP
jgi:hypothetical protein